MTLEITTYREYYMFDYGQTGYHLRYYNNEWELISKRKNLPQFTPPTYRYYDTLEAIEADIKGLKGLTKTILQKGLMQ